MTKRMKTRRNNPGSQGTRHRGALRVGEQKTALLNYLRDGYTIRDACDQVGLTVSTYYHYKRTDEPFRLEAERIRDPENNAEPVKGRVEVPDFPEFCETYLGLRLFDHQLQWFDVLEGREPRNLHPAQTFVPADPKRLVINTPPGHAKSQTVTMAYTTWRLVKDPSTRVVIVSKAQALAKQFLYAIKNYLTGPAYRALQDDLGPVGGWNADSASWTADQIYLSSSVRVDGQKDPNIQARGIGSHIYGSRSDIIILDDVVANDNAADWPKQLQWLQTEVLSREGDDQDMTVLVIGTRMAPQDLYGELLNPEHYHEDAKSPWTYMAQPAVLEYADKPEDWITLWPKSNVGGRGRKPDEDGLFAKWNGPALARKRGEVTPAQWARVYQQEQVSEDTVFKLEDIRACTKGWSPGLIPDDPTGRVGRPGGVNGLKVIAGMDPAAKGFTAVCVLGFEPGTNKRYVLHMHNEASMTPDAIRQLIRDLTTKYNVSEWRIEDNAFQKFLTLDSEIRGWLAGRGTILVPHTTGRNKHDENFGVMAMEGLFRERLIVFPRISNEAMKALVQQLAVWVPDPPRTQKTDAVMALWFAEMRCLDFVRLEEKRRNFNDYNREFFTREDMAERRTLNPLQAPDDNPYAVPQEWKVMA